MRIAFHTPLNAFDDGGISGDRLMARQLAGALRRLGHVVEPVTDARSYSRLPGDLPVRRREAEARRDALLRGWTQDELRPGLWFTYHSYYKAPDLLGPSLASRLGIPYVVAEASDSRRRASGEWAEHVALARASFAAADLHFWLTRQDRDSIAPWCGPGALLGLPPFLEEPAETPPGRLRQGPPRLVTVAMMRAGVKLESYRALAAAIGDLPGLPWSLTIIGDGPLRGEVEAAFAAMPARRLRWLGALAREDVARELAQHDLFVWPGLGEAYGLVYLEAQAAGLPVLAFDSGGVCEAVERDVTALLVPAGDTAALARALARLLADAPLRERMGEAARHFVASQRSPARATEIIGEGLARACTRHAERRERS